ncbi:hypothetical protein FS842_007574 [Serendipita sp. 407]|nr:hypothetical protein FS842_007574 [Serendipita sp. 407]
MSLSVYDIPPNDRVILVMGSNAPGKSTFINYASRGNGSEISHSLEFGTDQIVITKVDVDPDPLSATGSNEQAVSSNYLPVNQLDALDANESTYVHEPTKPSTPAIWFVDTPGFGYTYSDGDILMKIANFLTVARLRNLNLNTILYLHRIDHTMGGDSVRHLNLFANICGNIAMPNVVIVTTFWSPLFNEQVGMRRVAELKQTYWSDMIDKGCSVAEFKGSYESAHQIISDHNRKCKGILLSEELVVKHKSLKETQASAIFFRQAEQLKEISRMARKQSYSVPKEQDTTFRKKQDATFRRFTWAGLFKTDIMDEAPSILGDVRPSKRTNDPVLEASPEADRQSIASVDTIPAVFRRALAMREESIYSTS